MDYFRALLGLFVLIGFAWLISPNKKAIDQRIILLGVSLQIVFGVLVSKVSFVSYGFRKVSEAFVTFLGFSKDGAAFLFGPLAEADTLGMIFAFQVLPTIIFFSTVSAGLYYLGILQKIVYVIAWVMSKSMRLSGSESLSAAGNIFLGQTEAPLLVKPFISKMTSSELMCLMTGGMATIAGSVLAAFVAFLGGDDPSQQTEFAAHLLSASVMNAPAGIVIAKILVPETNRELINTELKVSSETLGVNLIDAMSRGAADGLKLALNVGGMLLAFIAVIAFLNFALDSIGIYLVDYPLSWFSSWKPGDLNAAITSSTQGQFSSLSMEYLLGQLFRPVAWIIGVEWQDTLLVGSLLGQKTAINEFIAYSGLGELKAAGALNPKSVIIATYALCGFSNFSSIAIQIGGIGGMAPNQQGALSKLGLKALLAATIACLMTATVAGAVAT